MYHKSDARFDLICKVAYLMISNAILKYFILLEKYVNTVSNFNTSIRFLSDFCMNIMNKI